MALRWIEGFENMALTALGPRKYPGATGALSNVTGWTGSRTAGQGTNNGAAFDGTTGALVGSVQNSWIAGWAVQADDASGLSLVQTIFPTVAFHNSVGQQLQFEMVAYNETKPGGFYWRMQVRRGATVLATSDKLFEMQQWYYIEVKATIRTGTNGSFEMRWWTPFSSAAVTDTFGGASITGINTASQGTDGADRIRISFNTSPTTGSTDPIYFDDMYFCDNTGSLNNDYLGRQIMEGLVPNGNGNSIDWDLSGGATTVTDAWAETNTTQSTIEDDKQMTSDTLDEKELATYTDLSAINLVTINGIQLHTQHRMVTAGNRNFVPLLRKTTGSPAEVEGTSVNIPSTSISGSSEVFEVDPNTTVAWVRADIQAYQFGAKTKS